MSDQKRYSPVSKKLPEFWHGADYNPDQWLHRPEILQKDIELMKKANCNVMALGIFAWAALEPREGEYNLDWLQERMDSLYKNGIYTILATPSGARPAWMSQKYPEVLRVQSNRQRILQGNRHNHCFSSPVYREKISQINRKLAERFKEHPGLILWHVSNEYSGSCHCEICQEQFREWLKEKYGTLEELNRSWWTAFWSHTYTDWKQIESPAPHGEQSIQALKIDWKRFTTDQTIDFFRNEITPLKELTPEVPVTTNFMGTFPGLDYWKFASEVDVVAWDSYPAWHCSWKEDQEVASDTAFTHDLQRSLKGGQPFLLMESTPSRQNWRKVAKSKKPGMHLLSSLQAVAHGSDTVQYFQWRMGRGGAEKFHGAVVDHAGDEQRRVFREVSETGEVLSRLDSIPGSYVESEAAIMFDWENRWGLKEAHIPRKEKNYEQVCKNHYRQFWKRGIPLDIVGQDSSLENYRLLIVPMLYMVKEGTAGKIKNFVEQGGTLVLTYFSGIVNENDLCFQDKAPGPLKEASGISVEEIIPLYEEENYQLKMEQNNELGLKKSYRADDFCEELNLEGAQSLARFSSGYLAESPALTVNNLGQGRVYYIASRNEQDFLADFYYFLTEKLSISPVLDIEVPEGVSIQKRTDGTADYLFLMNFTEQRRTLKPGKKELYDLVEEKKVTDSITLEGFGVRVLKRKGENK